MTQAEIDALTAFRIALHDPHDALARWTLPLRPLLLAWCPYWMGPFASVPCSWRGILCSPSSSPPRVVKLCLPHLHLSGPISNHLVAYLPFLQKLSLRQNSFSSSSPIPTSLSHLCSLFLWFYYLTEPLPPSLLTNLSNLQVFFTANNLLTGSIPTALPDSFHFPRPLLQCPHRPPSGQPLRRRPPPPPPQSLLQPPQRHPAPSLAHLRSLLYLWLDWNRLEGPIPTVLANYSSFPHLSLQGNDLQGILPTTLTFMRSLQVLSLSHNRLSDPLPSSLFSNSSLHIAQLADNAFIALSWPPPANTSSSLQVIDLKTK